MEFKVGDIVLLQGSYVTTITDIVTVDLDGKPRLVKLEETYTEDGRINIAHVSRLTKIKENIVDKLLVLYAGR